MKEEYAPYRNCNQFILPVWSYSHKDGTQSLMGELIQVCAPVQSTTLDQVFYRCWDELPGLMVPALVFVYGNREDELQYRLHYFLVKTISRKERRSRSKQSQELDIPPIRNGGHHLGIQYNLVSTWYTLVSWFPETWRRNTVTLKKKANLSIFMNKRCFLKAESTIKEAAVPVFSGLFPCIPW